MVHRTIPTDAAVPSYTSPQAQSWVRLVLLGAAFYLSAVCVTAAAWYNRGRLVQTAQDNAARSVAVLQRSASGDTRIVATAANINRIDATASLDGDPPAVIVRFPAPHAPRAPQVVSPWWHHATVPAGICGAAALAMMMGWLSAMRSAPPGKADDGRADRLKNAAIEAQRLELLGQLAAGVAHDFANVIQAVQASAYLIAQHAGEPDRVRSLAQQIDEAAGRSTILIRQILDFARHDQGNGVDERHPLVDPAQCVPDVCEMLSRILGGAYQAHCEVNAAGLPRWVRGEPTALQAAVMNLAINARDAMPDGGNILIRVVPDDVDSGTARQRSGQRPAALPPGLYARISVADHGFGMPPDVLARAPEPFFTTKPRGKGTGLGLASVYNFARRSGGAVSMASTPGQGTVVTFWLPAAMPAEAARNPP
ncbi:MAG: ATP-binding protein [Acetobacteraceae bacterium]|nr:ATP-binding protein [Acetobacteraceae bacterium]